MSVMRSYAEGAASAMGTPWDEFSMLPVPPGTSLGQMDAMSLFSEVVAALNLRPIGIVTPWATRSGDMSWEDIPRADTNISLWELSDAGVNAVPEITFGSPLPFVGIVTSQPMTTEQVRKMWEGTAYNPYETQAVYRQDDAKPIPTLLFLHWGERIDMAKLPKDVLALEPRARAAGGTLVFAAQVPVESSTERAPPPMTFADTLRGQMATNAAQPPAPAPPAPAPIVLAPQKEEPLHLGVPIAVGLGAAALGFFLWSKR